MYNVEYETADHAYINAASLLQYHGNTQTTRHFQKGTTTTKELVHFSFTITDPRQRLVFARPINPAFAIAEVIWILSGSNDLDWISFWNPRMRKFADKGVDYSYGAYGARLGSRPVDGATVHKAGVVSAFDQLFLAYKALKNNPISRQVVLNIYNNVYDMPGTAGQPASADIPCNITSCLLVRDGKLNWLQTMRSNDFIWGTPYNFMQWMTIQEIVAGWLELELGDYSHVVNSLHVYDNHFDELAWVAASADVSSERLPVNKSDLRVQSYGRWASRFQMVFDLVKEIMSVDEYSSPIVKYDLLEGIEESTAAISVPEAYKEWLYLLLAEVWMFKVGNEEQANNAIERTSQYYRTSWLQWRAYKEKLAHDKQQASL